MARTDNLVNFVTDICNATRTKTGKTDPIPLNALDTEIESISTAENLTDELTVYNSELTEQETSITTIIETLNRKAAYSGENTLNIFLQETEPGIKEGLWLQTNKTYNAVAFEPPVAGKNWITETTRAAIPYNFVNGTGERVGDFVYLFGGDGGYSTAYKYDLINNTYTKIASPTYQTGYTPSVAVGDFIYLFGYWGYHYLYSYNTATNTYQVLAKPLIQLTGSGATAVNNFIYTFGSDNSKYCKNVTRYNIDSNTWEQLSDCPLQLVNPYPVTYGTDIYLISPHIYGGAAPGTSYKYDTLTDTYTEIASPSDVFVTSDIYVDGDYIYVFGGTNPMELAGTLSYRYDILNGTYTQLSDTPYSFSNTNNTIIEYNGKHLVFGGKVSPKNVLDMRIEKVKNDNIAYDPSTVVINTTDSTGKSFKLFDDSKIITDISERNTVYFEDVVYILEDGTVDTTIPTYYIEGTQWVKFKN